MKASQTETKIQMEIPMPTTKIIIVIKRKISTVSIYKCKEFKFKSLFLTLLLIKIYGEILIVL